MLLGNVFLRTCPKSIVNTKLYFILVPGIRQQSHYRKFSLMNLRYYSAEKVKTWVSVTFEKENGEKITSKGKEGDSFLDVVVNNSLDFDGYGACEGTLACSTCHLIFKKEDYERLPDTPTDEELDMLDLAYGLTDTSRLGCQVCLEKRMDGITVKVPEGVADARNM